MFPDFHLLKVGALQYRTRFERICIIGVDDQDDADEMAADHSPISATQQSAWLMPERSIYAARVRSCLAMGGARHGALTGEELLPHHAQLTGAE